MSLKQAIIKIHQVLSQNSIDHALIGGFALAIHGISRATGDIDLLIDEKDRDALIQVLQSQGYSIRVQTPEILHFIGPVRLDVLLARRPVSRAMLKRSEKSPLLGGILYLQAEDLIGLKIQAYCNDRRRELQDKADIQFLFEKYPALDLERIKTYADFFGEWPVMEALWISIQR